MQQDVKYQNVKSISYTKVSAIDIRKQNKNKKKIKIKIKKNRPWHKN